MCAPDAWPLPAPRTNGEIVECAIEQLADVRALVRHKSHAAGLTDTRADEVVLAVNEVSTNTVQYSPRVGTLRIWREPETPVCEVHDSGQITDLAGGRQSGADAARGRGLFLVNHLCDLVQLRSGDHGTTIRLTISRWLTNVV